MSDQPQEHPGHGHDLDITADPTDQVQTAIVDVFTALRRLLEVVDSICCPEHGLDEDAQEVIARAAAERYGATVLTGDRLLLGAAEARGRLHELLVWPADMVGGPEPRDGDEGGDQR